LAVSTPIELAAATCRNPVIPVSGVTRPTLIVRLAADEAVSMTTNDVRTTNSCVVADDMFSSHVTCDHNSEFKDLKSQEKSRYDLNCNHTECAVTRTYSTFGDRAFGAVGPGLWNSLPSHLKDADISYSEFRRSLKTFLFGQWGHGAV